MLIYDKLMSELDPKLVKMQFQVSVIDMGYEAATYFEKYPGRFISIHLQDWSKDKGTVAIGQGAVDWKKLFTAAKKAGVKNYFVEMNHGSHEGELSVPSRSESVALQAGADSANVDAEVAPIDDALLQTSVMPHDGG